MGTFVKIKNTRRWILFSLAFMVSMTADSQSMSITGPTCITPGTQYQYIISGNWNGSTYMQWCVSGGTITNYGQCASGTPLPSVYVICSSGGTHNISLYTTNPSSNPFKDVYENVAFNPGAITSNWSQTINATNIPAQITCSAATGGNCGTTNYSYQWLQSSDNVNFSNYSATTQDLVFTQPLPHTTYFKRQVTETYSNTTGYSDVAVVFVDPLIGGAIITSCCNSNTFPTTRKAFTRTATAASAGTCNGAYVYEWQRSTDNINFSSFGAGSTQNLIFGSPATQTYYYRRKTSCSGEIKYTGSVKIAISTYAGVLGSSQVIRNGGSISAFNLSGVAGGDCNGSYSYQWQQSFNEIDWISVSGSPNSSSYTATLPETYLYFRVKITCGTESVYSNSVRIKNATIVTNIPNSSGSSSSLTPIAIPPYPTGTDANNMNYFRIRTITKPAVTTAASADALSDKYDVTQTTEYLDGLGRGRQSVVKNGTPAGNDLILAAFYDAFGRIAQRYLPYTDNLATGNFRLDPSTQQPAFYNSYHNNSESYFYSNALYEDEASPSNMIMQQTGAGKSFTGSGKGVRIATRSNTTAEQITKWTIENTAGSLPQSAGVYTDGQLMVTITSNEQDSKIIEYKTIDGQVILKKVQQSDAYQSSHDGWLCTYYVYDELNQLRFVIQPRAVEWLSVNGWSFVASGGPQIADELCFRYEYDQRRRMIVKKVPGAGEVWMVYDARDRLVMKQDEKMRSIPQQWMVTEFDNLNRPVRKGLWTDANDRAYHQNLAYNSTNYPAASSGYEVLTETYYDDYGYANVKNYDASYVSNLQTGNNHYPEAVTKTTMTRGMVTGTKTKVLTTAQYLMTSTYYDNKARPVQTLADNISTGVDITTVQYDFSGNVLSTYLRHQVNTTPYTILTKALYDHGGRILETRKVFNGGPEVVQTIMMN